MIQDDSHFEIAALISKFLKGELTAEERKRLDAWVAADEDHQRIWQRLTDASYLEEARNTWRSEDLERAWASLERAAFRKPGNAGWRRGLRHAAIWLPFILMAGGAGWWWWQGQTMHSPAVISQAQRVGHDIVPRGKVARLQMGDGRTVNLDGSGQDSLQEQDGTLVYKRGSRLSYQPSQGSRNEKEDVYNTIITPRGGEYQVTLADGTNVWLNAASSLRFPVSFNQTERLVYLSGEAYFEVAEDARHPFKVVANGIQVSVLGTRFNIDAYGGGRNDRIVLAQGSVRVEGQTAGSVNTRSVLLAPGQQAIWKAQSDSLWVKPVNVEAAIAWKNGLFLFDSESLGSIMRKLSLWYDIQVKYDAGVDRQFHFTGRIQKYDNIGGILHLLELTGKVKFRMTGRQLEVMPQK